MKMAENSPNRQQTLSEKVKLLVTSNFFISHNLFKRLVLKTHKNQGLFAKGLITRAITKRDHIPQQLLVTKQINVTGMQNK